MASLWKVLRPARDVPKKKQHSLLDFTKEVADALLSAGKGAKEAAGKKGAVLPSLCVNQLGNKQWLQIQLLMLALMGYIIGLNLKILEIDVECAQC